jgi:3'-phosphoadenosine 5'-phosphosulfate (PAPS) 3'-phosphatase
VWQNSGFSISIALEKDGVIKIGVVYDPVMKEFFYAEKGNVQKGMVLLFQFQKKLISIKCYLLLIGETKTEKEEKV